MNLAELLNDVVLRNPESNAILAPQIINGRMEEFTYTQLLQFIDGYARGFLELGIKKGDRVLVLVPISVDFYAILIALFKIGALGVLYEPKDITWQMKMTLEDINVVACITTPKINIMLWSMNLYRKIPKRILTNNSNLPNLGAKLINIKNKTELKILDLPAETPGIITFTSGSESIPKGICRTHGFLLTQHQVLQKHMNLTKEDVVLTSLPVFVLSMLAVGSFIIIPPLKDNLPWKPKTRYTLKIIKEKKVTMLLGSSAFLTPLVKHAQNLSIKFESVSRVMVGGCFLEQELIASLKKVLPIYADIEVIYGSTEVEPVAIASLKDIITDDNLYGYLGYCVGKPVSEVDVKIIPFSKNKISEIPKALKVGEIGEILVSGVHVNNQYIPQEPAWSMNKVLDGRKIWHRMGDGAYLDKDDRIWLVGRFKHMPDEILKKFPNYLESERELKQKRLARKVTAISLQDGIGIIVETNVNIFNKRVIERSIREIFSKHQIFPSRIFIRNKLPLDRRHNSKIDYGKMKEKIIR